MYRHITLYKIMTHFILALLRVYMRYFAFDYSVLFISFRFFTFFFSFRFFFFCFVSFLAVLFSFFPFRFFFGDFFRYFSHCFIFVFFSFRFFSFFRFLRFSVYKYPQNIQFSNNLLKIKKNTNNLFKLSIFFPEIKRIYISFRL